MTGRLHVDLRGTADALSERSESSSVAKAVTDFFTSSPR